MITRLIKQLDEGSYSCVVKSGECIRTFTRRGVIDLYSLSKDEPQFLMGATIADKVIGKGAAAIIAMAGVHELYSHVISQGGYDLLIKEGVKVSYKSLVPNIINRQGDDICPLEKLCGDTTSLEELAAIIETFITVTIKK